MNSENDDKDKKRKDQPSVFTPEPPQVMDPSEHPKKNAGDDKAKTKKKEKQKDK